MKTAGMLAGDGSITVNIDQRKLAFEKLARLPEDYIRRVSARDPAAIDALLTATSDVTDNKTLSDGGS